jgi:hypothetical protein
VQAGKELISFSCLSRLRENDHLENDDDDAQEEEETQEEGTEDEQNKASHSCILSASKEVNLRVDLFHLFCQNFSLPFSSNS